MQGSYSRTELSWHKFAQLAHICVNAHLLEYFCSSSLGSKIQWMAFLIKHNSGLASPRSSDANCWGTRGRVWNIPLRGVHLCRSLVSFTISYCCRVSRPPHVKMFGCIWELNKDKVISSIMCIWAGVERAINDPSGKSVKKSWTGVERAMDELSGKSLLWHQ